MNSYYIRLLTDTCFFSTGENFNAKAVLPVVSILVIGCQAMRKEIY